MFVFMIAALGFYFIYRDAMTKRVEKYYQSYAEHIVQSLSEDELIRQSLVLYFDLEDENFLHEFHPGSIFIFTRNIPMKDDKQDVDQLKKQLDAINNFYVEKNIPPPLYSIDQEHGKVKRLREHITRFPSALATGEACSQEDNSFLAMLVGFYTCRDLRRYGIQWNYAPVADVQFDPNNPVIGTRSFGSDPKRVAQNIEAYIEGLHAARCLDTVKHFPGHGDTSQDSHKTLPQVKKSWEQLEQEDLYPFHYVIEQKEHPPSAVMTTHIVFPLQDKNPSTLSQFWLTKVLRDDWHYKGIVVTDDMGMKGVQISQNERYAHYPKEVQAFIAGSDMLLVFNGATQKHLREVIAGMHAALENKDISKERLRQSVKRTILARLKNGVLDAYLQKQLEKLTKDFPQENETQAARQEKKIIQTLLAYSKSLDEQVEKLAFRLPRAEKVNETISAYGIRNLSNGKETIDVNLTDFYFFTDLEESSENYKKILNSSIMKKNKIQKLNKLSLKNFQKEKHNKPLIIFHSGKTPIAPLLKKMANLKREWQLILYSTQNPFPYSSFGKNFHKKDIFIDSLSNTPESINALTKIFIERKMPPRATFHYNPDYNPNLSSSKKP